jgi:PAS domain-containing protein
MSALLIEQIHWADLRNRAAARLTGGAAANDATARATDALAVLHALASSPDTARDALTLLHELQVLQVEVDMQTQELRESRVELESALRWQIELYDHQPVGCFTLDSRLNVHELNQTGAGMLGIERDHAYGLGLDGFVSAPSKRRLQELVGASLAGERVGACLLQLCPQDGPERPVRASIGADPSARRCFVVFTDVGDEQGAQPTPA